MQAWGFQVSPVISGAKDLISSAFSTAKREEKKKKTVIKVENKDKIFPFVFLRVRQTLG